MNGFEKICEDRNATIRIGEAIGRVAQPGDIIALTGDLGAGKTTLVQGIGRGIGLDERDIVSPTFTIVAEHAGGRIPLYHLDVYRLVTAEDLQDLGFDDYLHEPDGLIVIEWAGRVESALPEDRLAIELFACEDMNARRLMATANGAQSAQLLGKVFGSLVNETRSE